MMGGTISGAILTIVSVLIVVATYPVARKALMESSAQLRSDRMERCKAWNHEIRQLRPIGKALGSWWSRAAKAR